MACEEPGASPEDDARRVPHDGLRRLGRPAALATLAAAAVCVTAACSSPSSAPPPATPTAVGSVAVPSPSAAPASGPATTPVAVPTPVGRSGSVTATAATAAQITMFTTASENVNPDVNTDPLAACYLNPAHLKLFHLVDVAVTNNGWAMATVAVPPGYQTGQQNVYKRAHGAWAAYACGTSLVGGPRIPADVSAALGQVQAGLRAAGS